MAKYYEAVRFDYHQQSWILKFESIEQAFTCGRRLESILQYAHDVAYEGGTRDAYVTQEEWELLRVAVIDVVRLLHLDYFVEQDPLGDGKFLRLTISKLADE